MSHWGAQRRVPSQRAKLRARGCTRSPSGPPARVWLCARVERSYARGRDGCPAVRAGGPTGTRRRCRARAGRGLPSALLATPQPSARTHSRSHSQSPMCPTATRTAVPATAESSDLPLGEGLYIQYDLVNDWMIIDLCERFIFHQLQFQWISHLNSAGRVACQVRIKNMSYFIFASNFRVTQK